VRVRVTKSSIARLSGWRHSAKEDFRGIVGRGKARQFQIKKTKMGDRSGGERAAAIRAGNLGQSDEAQPRPKNKKVVPAKNQRGRGDKSQGPGEHRIVTNPTLASSQSVRETAGALRKKNVASRWASQGKGKNYQVPLLSARAQPEPTTSKRFGNRLYIHRMLRVGGFFKLDN